MTVSDSMFFTIIYTLLLLVVLSPLASKPEDFFTQTCQAMKYAFFYSLLLLTALSKENLLPIKLTHNWLLFSTSPYDIMFHLDTYALILIPIAIFVTWSIVEFSTWYMEDDPKISLFFKYLIFFLLFMILLVTSANLVTMIVGWEGVGIMSYLLIGWYFTRSNAGGAALQALVYNRIGDIGFFTAVFWYISWSYSSSFEHIAFSSPPTSIVIAFILAAASKSAQFGLHPWLVSAMEGPTPVSALLHSSTMVVAGIFLLIRIHPLISKNQTALTLCLCLGAISTLFAATSALNQTDIKKIIAHSTSSQLGLMMVALGLNLPHLAFFHICTHAFFKAMLFLCSGSIIHFLGGEQDIRKMGGLQNTLPFTTSCFNIGSLALMGMPYLAGFFSKDAIIEAANTSHINTFALALTVLATSFTAVYSLRLIFYISLQHPLSNSPIILNEDIRAIRSLKRLVYGSIMAGIFINQMVFPSTPTTLTMPTHLKILALVISIVGFYVAYDLAKASSHIPPFFDPKAMHFNIYAPMPKNYYTATFLNISSNIFANLLELLLKKMGPNCTIDVFLPPILKGQETQGAVIKSYLCTFLFFLPFSYIA
uniref:NADH-ubiquinone oxidoreductase chain 5 n=1 Tax=Pristimantis fenestratus TaxID=448655 RepID=A0A0S2A2V4_9NEOB|nr:NADH dehydrogenase subunit 5 [Pristimantis fenestratus]